MVLIAWMLPSLAEDFLLGADFFAQVVVGRDIEVPAFQDGSCLIHRPHRELRLPWRPQFPDEHHIQVTAKRIGNEGRHRHGAAWDPQHERVLSPIDGGGPRAAWPPPHGS